MQLTQTLTEDTHKREKSINGTGKKQKAIGVLIVELNLGQLDFKEIDIGIYIYMYLRALTD